MKAIAVDVLLATSGFAALLASLAFLRLRTALDRLHCASFVVFVTGLGVAIATVVQDGWTSRSWKVVALLAGSLMIGAASTHAVGRTLHLRDGPGA